MDRINGLNFVDIGGGKRGFRKKNKAAGIAGTEVTEVHMNALQEEVLYCIEQSGQVPAINDWTQLWKAIGLRISNLKILTVGTNFYVNGSTGSDANVGLTAGTAFASLQGAVNAISTRYIALRGVNLYVAAGTYGGVSIGSSLISNWTLIGNPASPASVTIDASSSTSNQGRAISVSSAVVGVSGFSLKSLYENLSVAAGGSVSVQGANRLIGSGASVSMIAAYSGSTVYLSGQIAVTVGGGSVIGSYGGSSMQLGVDIGVAIETVVFTLSAATFTTFVFAGTTGVVETAPSRCSFAGATPTGARFGVNANGVINTSGAGAAFFPGTTAGSASSGGQYL